MENLNYTIVECIPNRNLNLTPPEKALSVRMGQYMVGDFLLKHMADRLDGFVLCQQDGDDPYFYLCLRSPEPLIRPWSLVNVPSELYSQKNVDYKHGFTVSCLLSNGTGDEYTEIMKKNPNNQRLLVPMMLELSDYLEEVRVTQNEAKELSDFLKKAG